MDICPPFALQRIAILISRLSVVSVTDIGVEDLRTKWYHVSQGGICERAFMLTNTFMNSVHLCSFVFSSASFGLCGVLQNK